MRHGADTDANDPVASHGNLRQDKMPHESGRFSNRDRLLPSDSFSQIIWRSPDLSENDWAPGSETRRWSNIFIFHVFYLCLPRILNWERNSVGVDFQMSK